MLRTLIDSACDVVVTAAVVVTATNYMLQDNQLEMLKAAKTV